MERQSQLPVHRHFVNRRALRGVNHVLWNTLFKRLLNHCRVVWVQEHIALTFVQIGFMLGAGRLFDAVRIVQQYAEIADATDAGFGTDGWLAGFDTRVAEDAFL
ncbi:hypothetical protein D3C72_2160630 [compost metagenome]